MDESVLIRSAMVAAALLLAATMPRAADLQPGKPIRLVVSSTAGGVVDIRTRFYAPRLGEALGRPIVVDNRPGASGSIGYQEVAKAPPDGHTVLVGTITDAIRTATAPVASEELLRDLAPVAIGSTGYPVLFASSASGVQSVDALVALAKSRRDPLTCGTIGQASLYHLICALLGKRLGAEFVAVPYKGTALVLQDAATGQIQIALGFAVEARGHVEAGRIRPIAALGPERNSGFPDVRTMAELGHPGLEFFAWLGFFAPAKTPRAILERLNQALEGVSGQSETREFLAKTGAVHIPMDVDHFTDFIRREQGKWRDIVAETGIRAALQ